MDNNRTVRRTINAWVMYDWANSAFVATAMAAVLPVFFSKVAAHGVLTPVQASSTWGFTQTMGITALGSRFGVDGVEMATRLSLMSVGLWWAIFSIPLFRYVPEPLRTKLEAERAVNPIKGGFGRLPDQDNPRQAFFLSTVLLSAITILAVGIGAPRLGITSGPVAVAIALGLIGLGVAFSWLIGKRLITPLARRMNTKNAILVGLAVYATR